MARVILTTPGEDIVTGGDVDVIGTRNGGEVITLVGGTVTLDASFNVGGDTLVLDAMAASYTARLSGSQVIVEGGGLSVSIPVGTAGITLRFADGERVLAVDAASATVRLGEQTITTTPVQLGGGGAASGTYEVAETGAENGHVGAAQMLDRGLFSVADNALLPDDALPSATVMAGIAAPLDSDFFSIELEEGELLMLDIDGASDGLDSVVRVYGPSGVELVQSDDAALDPGSAPHPNAAGFSFDSAISFRAPSAGTYHFSVESYDQLTFGNYQLNVSIGPVASPGEITSEDVSALLSGYRWNESELTYGFPSDPNQYPTGQFTSERENNFQGFNLVQRNATEAMLSSIAEVTNLSFRHLSADPGNADLRYAMSDEPVTAYAYYPGNSTNSGASWYNNSGGRYDNPVPGNYAWATILHETGHALGLKHGHEAPAISLERDSLAYTIMSYRSYIGAPAEGPDAGYKNETWGYPQTLMMYDIAALQILYGPDFSHNAGNTVYRWNASTGQMSENGVGGLTPGGNRVFMTVWDGGGVDTYDLSNYGGGVTIDLRPGEWSQTSDIQLANLGNGNYAPGNVANALTYQGDPRSLIENAIGGNGADRITANAAANSLTGGGGDDRFVWSDADDALPTALDVIVDFDRSDDMIDLSAIDAIEGTGANDAFAFIGTAAFSGNAGELRYQAQSGSVRVEGDMDGDGVADIAILLANVSALSASDFYG